MIASFAAWVQPGDRIAYVGNTFADQLRNHGYVEALLLNEFVDDPISIRNLAWAGDTVSVRDRPTNFPTEESTLTEHQADLIIACFGMSESFAGEAGIENFKTDLSKLLSAYLGKQFNGSSAVRLVLVSPIAYENLGKLTPRWEQRNHELSLYTLAMAEVASSLEIGFIDLFEPSSRLMEHTSSAQLTTNGIHLNASGYWAVSSLLFNRLTGKEKQPWSLRIDAQSGLLDAEGVELSALNISPSSFNFQVKEEQPASIPPPAGSKTVDGRDTMIVENLDPGEYSLTIDGVPVATATHEEWAEGVPIDNSPAHQEAESFRSEVIDKNTQFTYSWKALNQVHIVGERRNSPSGRALPQEVIEFNELTRKKDESLQGGTELKIRQWQLAPNTKLTN